MMPGGRNAGGGRVNTVVGNDVDKGDTIIQGPKSTETAKQKIRPKLPIAGTESVKSSYAENLQSDTLFETFSYVPEGSGLGPHNRLNNLNKGADFLRFGVEPLALPRTYTPNDNPHQEAVPLEWENDTSAELISAQIAYDHNRVATAGNAIGEQERQPMEVLGEDYNEEYSSQALPRHTQGPTSLTPVYNNKREFYPTVEPSGFYKNNVPFRLAVGRGTWRHEL